MIAIALVKTECNLESNTKSHAHELQIGPAHGLISLTNLASTPRRQSKKLDE